MADGESKGFIRLVTNGDGMPIPEEFCPVGMPTPTENGYIRDVLVYSKADSNAAMKGDLILKIPNDSNRNASDLFDFIRHLLDEYALKKNAVLVSSDCNGYVYVNILMPSFVGAPWVSGGNSVYLLLVNSIIESKPISILRNIAVEYCERISVADYNICVDNAFDFGQVKNRDDFVGKLGSMNNRWGSYGRQGGGQLPNTKIEKRLSFLSHAFSKASAKAGVQNQARPNFKHLSQCRILMDIVGTTSWEDDHEMNFLASVVNAFEIHSFRWLCVLLGVDNGNIRASDEALKQLPSRSISVCTCSELQQIFGTKCPDNCGVTTPLALPYSSVGLKDEIVSFEVSPGGVYACLPDSYGGGRKRVSAEAYVEKKMYDPVGQQWAYQIWFKDSYSAEHRVNVFFEDITKADFCNFLRGCGHRIPYFKDCENLFRSYLFEERSMQGTGPGVYPFVDRAGWNGFSYISPRDVHYPNQNPSEVNKFVQNSMFVPSRKINNPYIFKQGYFDWGTVISEQSFEAVLFLFGVALVPIYLKIYDLPSYAFHFWGGTASQRRTVSHLASSLWGAPSFIRNFQDCQKYLDDILCLHNDSLLCFGEVKSQKNRSFILFLKRIFAASETSYDYGSFKHIAISTGERELKVTDELGKYKQRVINIEIDSFFPEISPESCFNSQGTISASVIREVESESVKCMRLVSPITSIGVERCFKYVNPTPEKEEHVSITTLFSLIIGIGEMVFIKGKSATALDSIDFKGMFLKYYSDWFQKKNRAENEALSEMVGMFSVPGKLQLESIDTPAPLRELDGYRFCDKRRKLCLILTPKFELLFCRTIPKKEFAELLKGEGILVPDKKGGLTTAKWLPGQRRSVRGFVLDLEKLGAK